MKTYIIPIKIEAVAIIEAENRCKAVRKVASKKHKFDTDVIGYKVDHSQIKACDKEKIFKNKFGFANYLNDSKAKIIKYLLDAPNEEQGKYYDDLGLDLDDYKN
ncbi:MAG: hypothetical protein EBX41_08995 [Chitinophagia bacterium]|nr:hypothetical protein [Chitinophagia bacterium]